MTDEESSTSNNRASVKLEKKETMRTSSSRPTEKQSSGAPSLTNMRKKSLSSNKVPMELYDRGDWSTM